MHLSKPQYGHHGCNLASSRINAYSNRAQLGAFIALLAKGRGLKRIEFTTSNVYYSVNSKLHS